MATRMPVEIEILQAMVLSIEGEVDLNECDRIEAMFDTFFKLGVNRWLVDLRGASYLDSEGVKLLYRCFSKVVEKEGRVAIICCQDGIAAKVLTITGMRREVCCFHDAVEAINFVNLN